MSFASETRSFRYALAAPNGVLLASDHRGMPTIEPTNALKGPWECEDEQTTLNYAEKFSKQLQGLGVSPDWTHFVILRKTVTVTTSDWEIFPRRATDDDD